MRARHLRALLLIALVAVHGLAAAGPGRAPVDRLATVAAQPGARIAIVQGSYDRVHNGHVELFESAADARDAEGRPKFDLVVVVPTRSYQRKPFLRASYERRLAELKEVVAEHPGLRGKVVVSEAQRQLPNDPGSFLSALATKYPQAKLSYVLGGDSFNESPQWPGFEEALHRHKIDLVVTARPGYTLTNPSRAQTVLGAARTHISATEIRAALDRGDISSVAHAVPRATAAGLKIELAQREKERLAGEHLLPGPRRSYLSFAALGAERPAAAVDLLAHLDETRLPEPTRERLATLQARVNQAHAELADSSLAISAQGIDPKAGYTAKLSVLRRQAGKIAGRYLFKRLSALDAKKVESITLLANLLGIPTPLAITHALKEKGSRYTATDGVLIPWVPGLETSPKHDFTKMDPKVLEALVVSRWFNEVVGNQDVWWAQFMRPKAAATRNHEILAIDFDDAFIKRDPRVVQKVLHDHFGIDRPLEDTSWTDKTFDFDAKVGWAPGHYDSKYTMYGPLLKAYVTGKIDLDIERIKSQLRQVEDVPAPAIQQSLAGYLDQAAAVHWGHVPLQAAERFVPREEFAHKLEQRIYRSVGEFSAFLDELKAARNRPGAPMYEYYNAMDTNRW